MDRKLIKANAKRYLGGGIFKTEWLYGLLIMLLFSLLSTVGSVAAIIIYGPLTYGVAKAFLISSRQGGSQIDVGTLFDGFRDDFAGTLLLGLLEGVFVFLWSLLFVIPGIVKSYAYSFAFFIKADHPEYDWKQCLDESQRMTKGHKGELFVLDLSFIGWFIVCCFTFGLGFLWLSPYMQMSRTEFYNQIATSEYVAEQPADAPEEYAE